MARAQTSKKTQKQGQKPSLPDMPSMEDFAQLFLDSFSMDSFEMESGVSQQEEDAYYEAFDRLGDMYEQGTGKKAVAIAKDILALSPYVVDARLFLIEFDTPDMADKIAACEEAVRLGEKFVGPRALREYAGELWMHIPARPYMRALAELLELYADVNRMEESFAIAEKILTLNENDNQGARYILLSRLIKAQQWDKAKALHTRYKKDYAAMWSFLGALVYYKKGKPNKTAERWMIKGHSNNRHFAPFLMGRKKVPAVCHEESYSPGDKSEALCFVDDVYTAYAATDGALDWAAGVLGRFVR